MARTIQLIKPRVNIELKWHGISAVILMCIEFDDQYAFMAMGNEPTCVWTHWIFPKAFARSGSHVLWLINLPTFQFRVIF